MIKGTLRDNRQSKLCAQSASHSARWVPSLVGWLDSSNNAAQDLDVVRIAKCRTITRRGKMHDHKVFGQLDLDFFVDVCSTQRVVAVSDKHTRENKVRTLQWSIPWLTWPCPRCDIKAQSCIDGPVHGFAQKCEATRAPIVLARRLDRDCT